MTINWPVKDLNGNYFSCTLVIATGANGITNILKVEIGGEQLDVPNEIVGLAEQNEELCIQGLPLSEALGNFLGLSQSKTIRSNNGGSESIKPIKSKPPSNLESVSSTQVKEETIEANLKPLAAPG